MNGIPPSASASGYRLKSELARVCLPAPQAQVQRHLAWTNSICLLFLVIGLAGFRPKPPPPLEVKPLEETAPVVIEVTPPPPAAAQPAPQEDPKEEANSEAPPVVVVTPESPAIVFSVPTVGNVIAPAALAAAPPATPLPRALPRAIPASRPPPPSLLDSTGQGGDRPAPPYPQMAKELRQTGAVILLLTADQAGVITSVEIKETSGSSILDRASAEFVKRHWTVAPGAPGRLFEATIRYELTGN